MTFGLLEMHVVDRDYIKAKKKMTPMGNCKLEQFEKYEQKKYFKNLVNGEIYNPLICPDMQGVTLNGFLASLDFRTFYLTIDTCDSTT